MPVSSATTITRHVGNAVTTVFAYNFLILANTDLKVTVDGVVKTITTDYAVSGVGTPAGGNVTFIAAPANGAAITFERNMAYARTTDYQNGAALKESTHDDDHDRAIMLIQQIKALLDLGIRLDTSVSGVSTLLPNPSANALIGWNSGLTGLENKLPADLSLTTVSAFIATLLDDTDAATARATLGLGSVSTENTLPIAKGGTGQTTKAAAFDALSPNTTQGDISYHNGTNNVRLAKGTALQVLRMNSGATAPEWATSSGKIIQIVNSVSGALATGTTAIPQDDTIPQNTEGTEFLTCSITPTNASNKLLIECNLFASYGAAADGTIALFQDSTANAIAAGLVQNVNEGCRPFTLTHYMTAGTTSATTFKIRIGTGSGTTVTFNGRTGARLMGGALSSSITITEIAV